MCALVEGANSHAPLSDLVSLNQGGVLNEREWLLRLSLFGIRPRHLAYVLEELFEGVVED